MLEEIAKEATELKNLMKMMCVMKLASLVVTMAGNMDTIVANTTILTTITTNTTAILNMARTRVIATTITTVGIARMTTPITIDIMVVKVLALHLIIVMMKLTPCLRYYRARTSC